MRSVVRENPLPSHNQADTQMRNEFSLRLSFFSIDGEIDPKWDYLLF